MAKDVFISHSAQDLKIAEEVCGRLERDGISCWMAPRDVSPGRDFGEIIIDAIEQTRASVLLLSEHSNDSVHVLHEIERAVSKRKTVFPVRVEDVRPSKRLELHVSSAQWIDAWGSARSAGITQLSDALRALLEASTDAADAREAAAARRRRWRARLRTFKQGARRFGVAAALLLVALGGLGFWLGQATGIELAVEGPALADVSLGGRLVGQVGPTAKLVALSPGDHRLQIEAQGYWPYEKTVSVRRGSTEHLVVSLMPVSVLMVAVTPPDATVSVDSRPIDAKRGVQLRDGNHIVDVGAPGYKPTRQTVSVANGQRTTVAIALDAAKPSQVATREAPRTRAQPERLGRLEVSVDPPDATVQVDGRVVGRQARLPAGTYALEVNAAGYEPHRQTIEVSSDETQHVTVALRQVGQADGEKSPRGFADSFAPSFGNALGSSLGHTLGRLPHR